MSPQLQLLGSKLGTTVMGVFESMQWAEEEIEQGKRRHPEKAAEIDGAFKYLCPHSVMRGMAESVHRLHFRTVIDRIANGQNPEAATPAEIACALSHASLKAPLNRVAVWIMWDALKSILPPDQEEPYVDRYDREHAIPGLLIDAHRALGKPALGD